MKTLLVYMSTDMYSHELEMHKTITLNDTPNIIARLNDHIEQYRAYFGAKRCSKVHIVVLDIAENNVTTVFMVETLAHPLREKIQINLAAKTVKRIIVSKTDSDLDGLASLATFPLMV